MSRYILDTNLIIRFLAQDHPTMSKAAGGLFKEAAAGHTELVLEATIVAEAIFVLTSFYKKERTMVADALRELIEGCRLRVTQREAVLNALDLFKSYNIDFPDALLAALAAGGEISIASFDRDFDRIPGIARHEPV
ncbi:MAG TPA: PIN domain-containing protein [Candidatus Limnocylindria bacterium]|nr:PIN domain-containing protein [Candidatus Limnocylindria bacterium]